MILDAALQFDPSNTAVTATAPSSNTVDLGCARDVGVTEEPMAVLVVAQTSFVGPANSTLNIQIQSSVDNATFNTLIESSPIAVANLVAGTHLLRTLLPKNQPAQTAGIGRYLRLNYVVTGGPFTGGTLQAGLAGDVQANPAYASGFNAQN